jgi:transcriptional regulator with PAS, ATPase and Fis domain
MNSNTEIPAWCNEFDAPITICNEKGIIVYMNDKSISQFAKYGGKALLGKNLLDCHPEPSKSQLSDMLKHPSSNIYTSHKKGEDTMVIQKPWTQNGKFKGLVEISFVMPSKMDCRKPD